MKCFLCGMEAEEIEPSEDGKHVQCPDCGSYVISNRVLHELSSRRFDFSKMRDDLHRQRQFNATSTAQINTETAVWA